MRPGCVFVKERKEENTPKIAMTNTEELIKIAIKNGWQKDVEPTRSEVTHDWVQVWFMMDTKTEDVLSFKISEVFLDKEFFIELGKGLGWKGKQTKVRTKDKGPHARVRYEPEEYVEYGRN